MSTIIDVQFSERKCSNGETAEDTPFKLFRKIKILGLDALNINLYQLDNFSSILNFVSCRLFN